MCDAKTDSIDTLVIAETIRLGRYKPSSVPQEKLLALRELCRNRFYLIDMAAISNAKSSLCWIRYFLSLRLSLILFSVNQLLLF